MQQRWWSVLISLMLLLAAAPSAKAIGNFCPFGTCDIADPVYVNVYWDPLWDDDIAVNDKSATILRIDEITAAICHSNYFSGLSQYSVNSCSVGPSIHETGCGPPPPNLDQARDAIGSFASCVMSNHPGLDPNSTILNVLLPPQVVPVSPDSYFCKNAIGQHEKYGSPVAVTFIPTACNQGIKAISAVMTHEMVEATTDPNPSSPTGWKDLTTDGDEVADICEHLFSTSPFLYGLVSKYYSDKISACTNSGVGADTQTATVTACGSGKNMTIQVTGPLDARPWDLQNGGAKSLFLQAAVSGSHTFGVGGFWNFPPDMVGFKSIMWTANVGIPGIPSGVTNSIVVSGFDDKYGAGIIGQNAVAAILPGDSIAVNAFSSRSGTVWTGSVTAPNPAKVQDLVVKPWSGPAETIFVGYQETLFGKVVDAGGCASGGIDLQISASDSDPNAISPKATKTYEDGNFFTQYTPSGPAGTHTVVVAAVPVSGSVSVPVHPNAESLDQTLGPVSGGMPVTLTGNGFDAIAGATKVEFRGPNSSAVATAIAVTSNGQAVTFTTPHSPLGQQGTGMVQVVATVNGQESLALAYQYFVPDQPILSFSTSCIAKGLKPLENVEVDAYDANGKPAAEQITLTATYPAFASGGQPVSTLSVSPGTSVVLNGSGPFSASPSANPALAVTELFPANAPNASCIDPGAKYYGEVLSYIPGPGPVESLVLQALLDRGGQSVVWANSADPQLATSYIALAGVDTATVSAAAKLPVRTLGSRDLSSLNRERPIAFVRNRAGSNQLRLLGPNFSIGGPASAAATAWRTPAVLSFSLPSGADPSQYAILYGALTAASWTEAPAFLATAETGFFLRANVTETGTYALARAERRR